MWLVQIRICAIAVFLICASRFTVAQSAVSGGATHCKKTINKADYEGRTDGPEVIDIGYATELHACVVIRNQGFPWKDHKFVMHTDIYDTKNLQTLWTDQRILPDGKRVNERYPALLKELKVLNIELAPR